MKALSNNQVYRRTGGWLVTLALVYGVFVGSLALMQKDLLYFPGAVRFVPQEYSLKELEPLVATTEDGLKITSWYSPPRACDKMTVVFFQGNAGHLGYRNYKVRPWLDAGYGVLMVGYRGFGNVVQTAGYNIMQNWWTQRRDDARWGAIAGFDPRLYLIAKVYYLRGLRYIYNDTTASAATFTAALNTRLAATNTPPAATAASPNPTLAVANDTNADLDARIAALTKAIGDMGDKLASNNNINVGASAARATAEGVEIVQLFERPVAFGYEPLAENIGPDKSGVLRGGIDELCRDFGAPRDQ